MNRSHRLLFLLPFTLLVAACGEEEAPKSEPEAEVATPAPARPAATRAPAVDPGVPLPSTVAAPKDSVRDSWTGEWTGPEGTSLKVERSDNQYLLTITSLDGPRTFVGRVDGDVIRFNRDGAAESLHFSDGRGTGMKWLEDKSTCLTVHLGEGYCRD